MSLNPTQPPWSGGAGSLGTPTEASRIRDGISQAEQHASELHETIAYLEKRLDTVLIPAPPQVVTSVGADVRHDGLRGGPPASHMLGRLAILDDQLGGANQRLRAIIQRIDV